MAQASAKRPACKIVQITPEHAEELLRKNKHNRSLRRSYVRKLADAMGRGEWTINGEPVQIAQDGTLLNGQHRLHAVVASGQTVPMLLVQGIPKTAQKTMDTGARRTLSDVLALREETHTTNLAASLALLHRYRKNLRMDNSGHTAPTPQEALQLLEREPHLRDSIPPAERVYQETRMRISVVTVLLHLFNETAPGDGTRFFEALCLADTSRAGDPLRALRDIIDRARHEPGHILRAYILSALTIKAFNAWSRNERLTELTFVDHGANPEAFPVIQPAT